MWLLSIGLAILLCCIILGIPVAFSIGLASVILMLIGFEHFRYEALAQWVLYGINNFTLLAVPLFLLAGRLMNSGGITQRIFRFANALVGVFRGGLGYVNVVVSMIFAGMSGAAVADVAGLGTVEIKAMDDAGYDRDFSIGITASSSVVGPIIPPSIPIVIFAIMAEISVGKLLIAGIIPGIVIGVVLMSMVGFIARIRDYPRQGEWSLRELWESFKGAFLSLLTPLILIGGILSGVFTATEAAAIAVLYALILGLFIYREYSFKDLISILIESMRDSAVVLFIVACAKLYSFVITYCNIPSQMASMISSITGNPWIILGLIVVLLLLLGCFMEPVAGITITLPVILPLAKQVGINSLHLGIVMVYTLVIGLLTPPVGLAVYTLSKVTKEPPENIFKSCIPFYIPLFLSLLVIMFCPFLTTWLPSVIITK